MNTFAVAVIALIASGNALPNRDKPTDLRNSIINEDVIIELIKDSIELIKEVGLDPYKNDGDSYGVTIDYPIPGFLKINGYFENFIFTGLSNIVVNSVSYDDDTLILDLSLPRIEASIDKTVNDVTYLDVDTKIELSGRLAINDVRARFVGQLKKKSSGTYIDDLNIAVKLGSIESHLNVELGGSDYSIQLNNIMERILPSLLMEYEEELNNSLSRLLKRLLNF